MRSEPSNEPDAFQMRLLEFCSISEPLSVAAAAAAIESVLSQPVTPSSTLAASIPSEETRSRLKNICGARTSTGNLFGISWTSV